MEDKLTVPMIYIEYRSFVRDKKTSIRIPVIPQPHHDVDLIQCGEFNPTKVDADTGEEYPGDRTTGAYSSDGTWGAESPYKIGDIVEITDTHGKPCPSPNGDDRYCVEITGVGVELLQDITVEGALREGVTPFLADDKYIGMTVFIISNYSHWWNMLHRDEKYSWDSNPLVWVYTFKKVIIKNNDS